MPNADSAGTYGTSLLDELAEPGAFTFHKEPFHVRAPQTKPPGTEFGSGWFN